MKGKRVRADATYLMHYLSSIYINIYYFYTMHKSTNTRRHSHSNLKQALPRSSPLQLCGSTTHTTTDKHSGHTILLLLLLCDVTGANINPDPYRP